MKFSIQISSLFLFINSIVCTQTPILESKAFNLNSNLLYTSWDEKDAKLSMLEPRRIWKRGQVWEAIIDTELELLRQTELILNTFHQISKDHLPFRATDVEEDKREIKRFLIFQHLILLLAHSPTRLQAQDGSQTEIKLHLATLLCSGTQFVFKLKNLSPNDLINYLMRGSVDSAGNGVYDVLIESFPAIAMPWFENGAIGVSKPTLDYLSKILKKDESSPQNKFFSIPFAFGGLGNPDINGHVISYMGTRFEKSKANVESAESPFQLMEETQHGLLYLHYNKAEAVNSESTSKMHTVLVSLIPSAFGKSNQRGIKTYISDFYLPNQSSKSICESQLLPISSGGKLNGIAEVEIDGESLKEISKMWVQFLNLENADKRNLLDNLLRKHAGFELTRQELKQVLSKSKILKIKSKVSKFIFKRIHKEIRHKKIKNKSH